MSRMLALHELGWPPLTQRRQEARFNVFYQIINGLTQVPFECVVVEAYKGTRRKHYMKFDILLIQLDSMDSRVFPKLLAHGTDLFSLKLRH